MIEGRRWNFEEIYKLQEKVFQYSRGIEDIYLRYSEQ